MKQILAFGDSNTWGYDPATGTRFDEDTRWTARLQTLLGDRYQVLECGINGRTTCFDEPFRDCRNGCKGLAYSLEEHRPFDLLIISLGGTPIKWYQKDAINYWPFFLVFLHIWKTLGYSMVVYLSSIKGIDESLYEAAMIDGATKWQQTRFITLPMLKTIMIIMFIMAVGKIFNSDFGLFYRTTRNSSSLTSVYLTLDVYVFNSMFNNPRPVYGYISAAGFLQSMLGCLTMIIANGIVRRIDNESALF